ncbi:hypothetical protein GOODEAATRI_005963 [Goodea atripinnis]|uniref:Neuronal tyrosine-phosphorylated phosphoinositide-3-kinase adapter C-terminal domain-containing protein n=1 Tax=Goodea atripinnis TaxID=208336 RepID=A0ABV0P3G2_9TELE
MLPRQETSRSNRVDFKYEGKDWSCQNGGDLPPPLLPRQESKDLSRTGLEHKRAAQFQGSIHQLLHPLIMGNHPMPWICGDTTMLEQIERKRKLCAEILSRQHPHLQRYLERPPPPDKNEDRYHEGSQCKQDSVSVLVGCGKSSGTKKIRPPPYPTQTTVFWDTAI